MKYFLLLGALGSVAGDDPTDGDTSDYNDWQNSYQSSTASNPTKSNSYLSVQNGFSFEQSNQMDSQSPYENGESSEDDTHEYDGSDPHAQHRGLSALRGAQQVTRECSRDSGPNQGDQSNWAASRGRCQKDGSGNIIWASPETDGDILNVWIGPGNEDLEGFDVFSNGGSGSYVKHDSTSGSGMTWDRTTACDLLEDLLRPILWTDSATATRSAPEAGLHYLAADPWWRCIDNSITKVRYGSTFEGQQDNDSTWDSNTNVVTVGGTAQSTTLTGNFRSRTDAQHCEDMITQRRDHSDILDDGAAAGGDVAKDNANHPDDPGLVDTNTADAAFYGNLIAIPGDGSLEVRGVADSEICEDSLVTNDGTADGTTSMCSGATNMLTIADCTGTMFTDCGLSGTPDTNTLYLNGKQKSDFERISDDSYEVTLTNSCSGVAATAHLLWFRLDNITPAFRLRFHPAPLKIETTTTESGAATELVVVPYFFGPDGDAKQMHIWSLATTVSLAESTDAGCDSFGLNMTCTIPALYGTVSGAEYVPTDGDGQDDCWSFTAPDDSPYTPVATQGNGVTAIPASGGSYSASRTQNSAGGDTDCVKRTFDFDQGWLTDQVTLTPTALGWESWSTFSKSTIIPQQIVCTCKTPLYIDITVNPVAAWFVTLNPYGPALTAEGQSSLTATLRLFRDSDRLIPYTFSQGTLPKSTTRFYFRAHTAISALMIQISNLVAAPNTAGMQSGNDGNRIDIIGRYCHHKSFGVFSEVPCKDTTTSGCEYLLGGQYQSGGASHDVDFQKFRFEGQPTVFFGGRVSSCEPTNTVSLAANGEGGADYLGDERCGTCGSGDIQQDTVTADFGDDFNNNAGVQKVVNDDIYDEQFNGNGAGFSRRMQEQSEAGAGQESFQIVQVQLDEETPTITTVLNNADSTSTQSGLVSVQKAKGKKKAGAQEGEDEGEESGLDQSTITLVIIVGVVVGLLMAIGGNKLHNKADKKQGQYAKTPRHDEPSSLESGQGDKYAKKVSNHRGDVL